MGPGRHSALAAQAYQRAAQRFAHCHIRVKRLIRILENHLEPGEHVSITLAEPRRKLKTKQLHASRLAFNQPDQVARQAALAAAALTHNAQSRA